MTNTSTLSFSHILCHWMTDILKRQNHLNNSLNLLFLLPDKAKSQNNSTARDCPAAFRYGSRTNDTMARMNGHVSVMLIMLSKCVKANLKYLNMELKSKMENKSQWSPLRIKTIKIQFLHVVLYRNWKKSE